MNLLPGKSFFSIGIRNPFIQGFVAIGFVQGLLNYFLVDGIIKLKIADNLDPRMIAVGFLFYACFAFFLSYVPGRPVRAAAVAVLFGLLQAALRTLFFSVYALGDPFMNAFAQQVLAMVVCYVAMPFVQIYVATGRMRFPYEALFQHSWNNIQISTTSYVLTGLFFGVVALSCWLLKIVQIDLFWECFSKTWFLVPALFTVKAIGYAMARDNEGIVASLRKISLGFCRFLGPILSIFAIIFVVGLLTAGMEPIWKTRVATPLLLSFVFLTILFFNSVFQDGSSDVYFSGLIGKIQRVALVLLPVFAGLAAYSIYLRFHQYGLTPQRYYGLLVTAVAGLYALLYAVAALCPLQKLQRLVTRGNIAIALLVIGICILAQIPQLCAASLSAQHQYMLLASGKIAPDKFDYYALEHDMGDPGRKALTTIQTQLPLAQGESVQASIRQAKNTTSRYAFQNRPAVNKATDTELLDFSSYMPVKLADVVAPNTLSTLILSQQRMMLGECREKKSPCALIGADIDGDGQKEAVLVYGPFAQVYTFTAAKGWEVAPYSGRLKDAANAKKDMESMVSVVKPVPSPLNDVELNNGARLIFSQ